LRCIRSHGDVFIDRHGGAPCGVASKEHEEGAKELPRGRKASTKRQGLERGTDLWWRGTLARVHIWTRGTWCFSWSELDLPQLANFLSKFEQLLCTEDGVSLSLRGKQIDYVLLSILERCMDTFAARLPCALVFEEVVSSLASGLDRHGHIQIKLHQNKMSSIQNGGK
jgi:hypothetical protein